MTLAKDDVFAYYDLPNEVIEDYITRCEDVNFEADDSLKYFDHAEIEVTHFEDAAGNKLSVIAWLYCDACNHVNGCKGHPSALDVYDWLITYDPPR